MGLSELVGFEVEVEVLCEILECRLENLSLKLENLKEKVEKWNKSEKMLNSVQTQANWRKKVYKM